MKLWDVGLGDETTVMWKSRELLTGPVSGATDSRTFEILIANYIQQQGVVGGENSISFKLAHSGTETLIERVRILPDSGIYVTEIGPPDLALDIRPIAEPVSVGSYLRVPFVLRNSGRPARSVVVRAEGSNPSLVVVGDATIEFPVVEEEVSGTFLFRAADPGPTHAVISVTSDTGGQPRAEMTFEVLSRDVNSRSTSQVNMTEPDMDLPLLDWRIGVFLSTLILGATLVWLASAPRQTP